VAQVHALHRIPEVAICFRRGRLVAIVVTHLADYIWHRAKKEGTEKEIAAFAAQRCDFGTVKTICNDTKHVARRSILATATSLELRGQFSWCCRMAPRET